LPPLSLLGTLAFLGSAFPATATTPAERVICTAEPRSRWMPEEEARKIFGAEKYALVKFKVSRTNCYEFYAVGRNGGVVEAYYHPVTGRLVKETRVGEDRRAGP
ncbi:MAG TPA: PepSY domain-containing protein, partial [Usitatibacteraceae bacterium]|nr:PepSY domain-containing protein [Usitatibacteraceae bacterium]